MKCHCLYCHCCYLHLFKFMTYCVNSEQLQVNSCGHQMLSSDRFPHRSSLCFSARGSCRLNKLMFQMLEALNPCAPREEEETGAETWRLAAWANVSSRSCELSRSWWVWRRLRTALSCAQAFLHFLLFLVHRDKAAQLQVVAESPGLCCVILRWGAVCGVNYSDVML